MRLGDLVDQLIGKDRYTAACVWAYSTSSDEEFSPWPADLADIPATLQTAIWARGDVTIGDRLSAAMELYRAMPSAANAEALVDHYYDFGPAERDAFKSEIAALLESGDGRLAGPITHVMSARLPVEAWRDVPESH